MNAFLKDKFEYNHNSNVLIIERLKNNPDVYIDKTSILASHILNAHHIWNHRAYRVRPALIVWQLIDLENLEKINNENLKHSLELLENNSTETIIPYKNSKGEKYENSLAEIFFHIINHSTYHRGQIMNLLKTKNVKPVITDYIFYKR